MNGLHVRKGLELQPRVFVRFWRVIFGAHDDFNFLVVLAFFPSKLGYYFCLLSSSSSLLGTENLSSFDSHFLFFKNLFLSQTSPELRHLFWGQNWPPFQDIFSTLSTDYFYLFRVSFIDIPASSMKPSPECHTFKTRTCCFFVSLVFTKS